MSYSDIAIFSDRHDGTAHLYNIDGSRELQIAYSIIHLAAGLPAHRLPEPEKPAVLRYTDTDLDTLIAEQEAAGSRTAVNLLKTYKKNKETYDYGMHLVRQAREHKSDEYREFIGASDIKAISEFYQLVLDPNFTLDFDIVVSVE